ncbi:hypothetical protein GSI_09361 [Ganoderma sinense ZZ0214-1]|uniref:Uncharacterized protein n=1 Tax=Ganoderma sinense ZZ0214-1 TaxID=1077348 RepID=A0A2G8S6A6_9APHY|nr:hypothetical protein GSI_09361 [Ganoderma sinense ZZ0214-1]
MERPANASSSNTVQGPAANGTSNDGPTARLNALATSMGAADPFHAMMLAGYRATEPLGLYASYTAQQVAVAQNEHIKQCTADLRGDMAKITDRLDDMSSVLNSASGKIRELEQRDEAGIGPQKARNGGTGGGEDDMEKRLQDAIRASEEKAEKRLLDAVRMLEEKVERRLLDAIRASEDKMNRRCDKMLEELESNIGAVERWVGVLQKQADDLKIRTEAIELTLGEMEKKFKALEEKLGNATNDLAVKHMKLTNDTINEFKLKTKDGKPANERGPMITVEGLELAVKELEELTFGSISVPVHANFIPPPSGLSASNRAQPTFAPGASGPMIGTIELYQRIRQVTEYTNKGFEGLKHWILYLKSRSVGVERSITRRENARLGYRPDVEYLDVPCPDGSCPGSWQVDGKRRLRNSDLTNAHTP